MLPFVLIATCLVAAASAASTFTPARPPALPLAVKSPYLNVWLNAGSDGGNGGYIAGKWPVFWSNQVNGWAGIIRVDGTSYTWLGDPGPQAVTQTSYEYTSTRSTFTMDVAGKVQMNITFLSPVTPNDIKRQSLTFSYLNVEVVSSDGQNHDIELYSDISAEWVSGDRTQAAQWNYTSSGGLEIHQVYKQNQQIFSEYNDQAEWGNFYYATDSGDGVTYQIGQDTVVRGSFTSGGKLSNQVDDNYRVISNNWPVFGFAKGLGSVGTTPTNTLFTIGLCQQEALQFLGAQGTVSLPSLWRSYFTDDIAALDFFHKDFATASGLATDLDNKVNSDAIGTAGQDYANIVSLSVRQVFAAWQLVGTENKTYLFQKEISSNGNTQTVDVIFPAMPILLYTNPDLLKLMLDPLFENQESGHYPNNYSIHDLGAHYPNATGHPDGNDEAMPLEECGNMIIMALAYAQRSGNSDYLNLHYPILNQWSSYLVEEALYPFNQISTDDFAGSLANQTNLALKGIIGIEAMSQISNLTGHADDASKYHQTAVDYITRWQGLAIVNGTDGGPAHTTLSYGDAASHGLLYNLYANSLLGFNLVPQSVYDIQSAFYPTIEMKYGVPLDTRHSYTKSDWEMFVAAVASTDTRDMFIRDLAKWINETPTSRAFTDLYETDTGAYPSSIQFVARPVQGGTFALLALPVAKS
ncbi:glutaminase GtaA [Phyllosticta paracitricarpa]|uniref:Glutaminase GtaA n=2 Tax=Phyllosticta TaxID=121621 RepID=A0ABR1MKY3_9PEZI